MTMDRSQGPEVAGRAADPATGAAAGAAIILASGSATRRAMLEAAGVPAEIDPASVDEGEVKAALRADGADAAAVAEALAEVKARQVSRRHPGRIVIGADQMLDCEGRWFDKPEDRAQARRQLLELRGRAHVLISTAVAVRDGARIWHGSDRARLLMRPFSEAFLDTYLDRVGSAATRSVGGYQVEGPGVQLFAAIEGNHFTILGLPLLPLLAFLREHGVVGQ